jgi:hypothetical protein
MIVLHRFSPDGSGHLTMPHVNHGSVNGYINQLRISADVRGLIFCGATRALSAHE